MYSSAVAYRYPAFIRPPVMSQSHMHAQLEHIHGSRLAGNGVICAKLYPTMQHVPNHVLDNFIYKVQKAGQLSAHKRKLIVNVLGSLILIPVQHH